MAVCLLMQTYRVAMGAARQKYQRVNFVVLRMYVVLTRKSLMMSRQPTLLRAKWRQFTIVAALLLLLMLPGMDSASVHAQFAQSVRLPLVYAPPVGHVVIAAAHIDSAMIGEADEAILLWNASRVAVDLTGWTLEVNGRRATFAAPGAPQLDAGERLWCAAQASAFRISFGHAPACEWAADTDPVAFDLAGATLQLRNTGGVISLRDANGTLIDTLLYGNEVGPVAGWQGAPVQLYTRGALAREGQIWQRKVELTTMLPIDRDLATDWASDLSDVAWGRRVRFPGWRGWDATDDALPTTLTTGATITVAVAPEGLYAPLAAALTHATHTLDLSLYTFEHPELAQHIATVAQRGVHVRLLLEGGPPGGISDLQRWCVRLMAQAGVDVRYLAAQDDAPRGLQPRYRYTHAKYGIVDGTRVFVGTENFSLDAMPVPPAESVPPPVGGRRGAYFLIDAPLLAAAFANLFAADWSPDRFADLQPYVPGHTQFGDPSSEFTLPALPNYNVDDAPFRTPHSSQGDARFILITAPENALHPDAGLNALLAQAGAGDELYLAQLYEHKYWYLWLQPIMDAHPKTDTGDKLPALLPQLPV